MSRIIRSSIVALVILSLVSRGAGQEKYTDPVITPAEREHWAFRKPIRSDVTSYKRFENPIDAFIHARLRKEGLKSSPEADKVTLIRRLTLDLTGLPPTPAEVEAFLKDKSPGAYETVVDRLLASPHFGERWAQHWLDVVRFAESNGFELDADRPQAWRYRDYVIKSFNDDKPYDRFVLEQVAGDELAAGKDAKEAAELWIATGMHRCASVHMVSGNLDEDMIRQEKLLEMVNGVGSAFLGLTVGCARCHDHKFDPISAGDYYRLQAFFSASQYKEVNFATADERAECKKLADLLNAKAASLKKQIADIDAPYRKRIARDKREKLEAKYREALDTPGSKRTPEQKRLAGDAATLIKVTWDEVLAALTPKNMEKRASLRVQLHDIESQLPPPTAAAWAIQNEKEAETYVLKRGDPKRKLVAVGPGFPRVIADFNSQPKTRLDLAKWITAPENPLTARVIVNRLWHYHFGRGLVATPNDFGTRGERPTHPELLDWLATELIDHKWSLKHIHRLIVTSATYKQAATTSVGAQVDPNNRLLWRMNRRRLEAESIRDSILAAAGTLNRKVGGMSVRVPLEPEVYDLIFTEGEPDGLWPVTLDVAEHSRRSIYLFNKRNVRLPLFEAFDQPDSLNSCASRPVSTYAPQALILMNAPFVREQGKALALALVEKYVGSTEEQIDALYLRSYGRYPSEEEIRLARRFLNDQAKAVREKLRARRPVGLDCQEIPAGTDPVRVRALADLCVVIFNTHEFVYVP